MRAEVRAVDEEKKSGQRDKAYGGATKTPSLPEKLKTALMKHRLAWGNFRNFAPSYRTTNILWVSIAKCQVTRKTRIIKVVEYAAKNVKPGMM